MDMASVTDLEPELLLAILAGVDPRAVKMFGRTCRDFRGVVAFYERTGDYAASLVRFVTEGFTSILVGAHYRCAGGILAAARAYAQHMAAALAGRPLGAPPAWDKAEYLRLLYPVALCLPDWPCAPYALEWCARHEHEIVGGGVSGPRHELLALLSADALGRLATLVLGGAADVDVDGSVAATDANDSKEMHKKVLRVMMAAAARRGHRVPMVAAAAATIACSGAASSAVEERLTGLRVAACALRGCKLSEADRHWLDLTGVSGNPKRSPRVMLSAFDCGGDSQFRLMLLLSEGGGINVSVPDPWLGALILACNT
jgi:hypothetical protein